MIRKTEIIKQETMVIRQGSSVQAMLKITTWWVLFIPVFRSTGVLSYQ